METKFIVIRGMTGYIIPFLLNDLETKENVIVRKGNIVFKSRIHYLLYKVHNSKRLNQLVRLPLRNIWLRENLSFLENYQFDSDVNYYIVILNLAANTLSFPRIGKIKKANVKLILAFFDPISDSFSSKLAFDNKQYFDLVMTFDNSDASKYGFKLFFQRYSKFKLPDEMTTNKLYFIGHGKGRTDLLSRIARKLETERIMYNFKIVGTKKTGRVDIGEEYLSKPLAYPEVLNDVAKTNGLLEIIQNGQTGATARYVEAVCYNKKLLTNNRNIVDFPYYNPRYMKIFSTENDIDYEWLKKDEDIDYGYKDDFSPLNLLDEIENLFG